MTILTTESETITMQQVSRWRQLTLADGLLGLVLLAGALLRLVQLGQLPLSPAEAEEALLVWRFWQPDGASFARPFSPAYFSLTSLLSQVVGISDVVMRIVPALFGSAVILLVWFLRHHLGPVGVLVTAALLATSPGAVAASRVAGGEAMALFATFLLFIAWLRYTESGTAGWFYALTAAVGLGIATAPLFYTGLATLAVAWLVSRRSGPAVMPALPRPDRRTMRMGLVIAAAVFFVVGTLFLWNPAGIGGAATLLATWIGQFSLGDNLLAWTMPVLALFRYEPILISLGLVAVAWSVWRPRPLAGLLVYWMATAILLLFLQPGQVHHLLLLTLPGYLLIGLMTQDAFRPRPTLYTWLLFALVLVIGGLAYANLIRLTRAPGEVFHLWLTVIALVVAISTINYVRAWDVVATRQGPLLGILCLFILFGWSTARWLGYAAGNDPRELWVSGIATDDDVPLLVDTVHQISQQVANSNEDLDILSAIDQPILRWYLRDYQRLQVGETVPAGARNQLILTSEEATPALGADYIRTDFGLIRPAAQANEALVPTNPLALLRWWLLHDTPREVVEERVAVWLRADLVKAPD